MAIKVGMVSLGCPKNQVDGEILLSRIFDGGFELAGADAAEVVVVNTCGFIESAKQESIDAILECCGRKAEGQIKCVVVTGCLAQRYQQELADEIPEVDVVLGIGSNSEISSAIRQALSGGRVLRFEDKLGLELEGFRTLSTPSYFAYLKIAEGCDNRCAYCAIPEIRGAYRSRGFDDIIKEANWLAQGGVKEIIIVAQDITRYGEDIYSEVKLPELLTELCRIDGFEWIRVMYCYPEKITDKLLAVIQREQKICKYLDVPIQHISSPVLKAMNRRSTREEILDVINRIRQRVPGIVLRTSLIAGFPGETPKQFEELAQFVKDAKFQRLGCFAYSQEEGTPAANMPNQIRREVKERRAELIMLEQQEILEEYNKSMEGKIIKVLVEGFDDESGCYYGRSEADAPEIDSTVQFVSENQHNAGDFATIRIVNQSIYYEDKEGEQDNASLFGESVD